MVDVDLPIEPLRRQIAFTTPLYPRPPRVPFTIDYSTTTYFHGNNDGSGLLIGIADKEQAVGFNTAVTTDWHDQLRPALAQFAPSLTAVEFTYGWAGLYEMTPDCNALIGEADTSGFRFLYAAGFSGRFLRPAVGEAVRPVLVPARRDGRIRCQTVPREYDAPGSTSSAPNTPIRTTKEDHHDDRQATSPRSHHRGRRPPGSLQRCGPAR